MTGQDYAYMKRWRYDRAHGIKRTIPAAKVRLHLATLQGAGWSLRSIAGAADTSASSLYRVANGEQQNITRKLAVRVLAVNPAQVPTKASKQTTEPFVSRVGTVRRIQALLCMGWGHQRMLEHSGVRTAVTLNQQGRWVTRSTHDAIAAMYAALAMTPGPSTATRSRAQKLGYRGPLDWDDIDLDAEPETADPIEEETLDEQAIWRRMHGDKDVQLTVAEKAELARLWRASGRSLNEMERLTGINTHRYLDEEQAS